MSIPENIMSAIVAMASLSLPAILGFLLYSALDIRKDLSRELQGLRQDMSAMNSRLGRIEGRLFGVDTLSSP